LKVEEMGSMFGAMKVVSVTDAAAVRIKDIVAKAEKPALGLKVGITKGGCAGMEYTFEVAYEAGAGDEVVTDKGATVIVDGKAVLFLFGTELDFRADKLSAHFVFNNPNQTSACGCGESVSITPVLPRAVPSQA
jgi:iron-sulfur cluster assembly protein